MLILTQLFYIISKKYKKISQNFKINGKYFNWIQFFNSSLSFLNASKEVEWSEKTPLELKW
jgi:hypothetical protein